MQAAEPPNPPQDDPPVWTYPTRFCRICREDVPATVTMYPPGLPVQFQTPIVEYKNEDEYGRLIKPCKCRGSLRYIHELCLLRSRTENNRKESMWKCHECGHQFDFKKLTIQKLLSNRISATFLTVFFMLFTVFLLGFIADPIINIYMDPYDSLTNRESIWDELEVRSARDSQVSAWSQHFAKGFISMGLVGFLKTLFLNPFQWINIRFGSSWTSTRTTTGRDRAVNISWIAIAIGVCSAFVFFYKWVQAFVQRSLQRIGNNIVDTQLPGDDDDLKPPAGWKHHSQTDTHTQTAPEAPIIPSSPPPYHETTVEHGKVRSVEQPHTEDTTATPPSDLISEEVASTENAPKPVIHTEIPARSSEAPLMTGSWISVDRVAGEDDNAISGVHRQSWSFSNL